MYNPNNIPETNWEMTEHILKSEGGFVNDPDDLGGATKFGVTLDTLKRLKLDINNDKVIDVKDVKALTLADAFGIFEDKYLFANNIDKLGDMLKFAVYDAHVNTGPNGAKVLQRTVNKCEGATVLKVDGVLGPKSLELVDKWYSPNPALFTDAYLIERRNYYFSISDKRVKNRKYCVTAKGGKGGWIKHRAERFMTQKFRLTIPEFNARISNWK